MSWRPRARRLHKRENQPHRLLRGGGVPPSGAFGLFTLPLRAAPLSLGEPVFFADVCPVD
jgi:hypothetical protein